MDKKLMESYLDNIAELVIDEDKIVTYKSLSKSFGIHVNTAKQLLYIYLSKEKSKNSFPISATYLLAGKLKDGSFNITIVNESDLKSTYCKFIEITSEHVYSIQKGKNIKDVKVLCGVDKDSSSTGSPTVIKCSKSVLKARAEVKKKPDSTENQNKKIIEDAFAPRKETTISSEPKNTEASSTNKEISSKSPTKKSPPKNSPKGSSSKAEVKKPTGSIASMFAKAAQKKAEKSVKEKQNTPIESETKDIEPADSPVEITKEAKSETGKINSDKVPKPKENSKKKKSGNKRKRIQLLSDSEESDSSNEETSPAEENSPVLVSSIEEEKEEQKDIAPRNKRKKRKLVDKTVMNEDGYLETRKEVVLETDSEDDSEEDRKRDAEQKKAKITPATEKGKNIPTNNAAKKQASLLNFFKKS